MVHLATPLLLSATEEQPAIEAALSWKLTVPVGVPLPVTFTVKVTFWPTVEVYRDESMVSLVATTPFTVCVIGPATPEAYVASPE